MTRSAGRPWSSRRPSGAHLGVGRADVDASGAVGLLAGGALVVGAGVAWVVRVPPRVVAGIMAFGAGVLISALAFELTDEAARTGGLLPTVVGFLVGAGAHTAAGPAAGDRSASTPRTTRAATSSTRLQPVQELARPGHPRQDKHALVFRGGLGFRAILLRLRPT